VPMDGMANCTTACVSFMRDVPTAHTMNSMGTTNTMNSYWSFIVLIVFIAAIVRGRRRVQ